MLCITCYKRAVEMRAMMKLDCRLHVMCSVTECENYDST